MWNKEIKVAIQKKQQLTIRLIDGEVHEGIPEACTDRVKLRNDNGVIYIPLADIKHVSRVIELKCKTNSFNK
ncbi:hypothetical protein MNQ98_09335 [Paenibacillus sp. N3/727]|uniref:hypothetical protein n=1 Tax=Paenibacillus sp. N3/727 TaxID=2925845 RepID=UPI001F5390BE|nr:hypothetical protein [Paenibacillus sp. N3/727]UNK20190.1 hypothetical protein MNQ98_09335 [Paenibacillus sp. N3/727]